MSGKCNVCGVNFVGVPELPIPDGICVRCDNERLRRENAQLAAALIELRGWITQVHDKCWSENISLGELAKRIPDLLQSDIGATARDRLKSK